VLDTPLPYCKTGDLTWNCFYEHRLYCNIGKAIAVGEVQLGGQRGGCDRTDRALPYEATRHLPHRRGAGQTRLRAALLIGRPVPGIARGFLSFGCFPNAHYHQQFPSRRPSGRLCRHRHRHGPESQSPAAYGGQWEASFNLAGSPYMPRSGRV
jgi:hypothetical protein